MKQTEPGPAPGGCPPGYTCGEEAYRKIRGIVDDLCRKHGILKQNHIKQTRRRTA